MIKIATRDHSLEKEKKNLNIKTKWTNKQKQPWKQSRKISDKLSKIFINLSDGEG